MTVTKMEESKSSLQFITCDQLRNEFKNCLNEVNKRILIIDVRHPELYERSHLCLDSRNSTPSTETKVRVMNIDPDLLQIPTAKHILALLEERDSKTIRKPNERTTDSQVFRNRRDATDVVLIDSNTDSLDDLKKHTSKVMRIIFSLTKFDIQREDKIQVPIKILEGGYRELLFKYPHFTTDSSFDPDSKVSNLQAQNAISSNPPLSPIAVVNGIKSAPNQIPASLPNQHTSILAPPKPYQPANTILPQPIRPMITKPVPKPPTKEVPKPNVTKNAPGTAVPVTPILSLRSPLSRSHSSPNVAQPDGDELEIPSGQLDRLLLNESELGVVSPTTNSNVVSIAPHANRPRFDRNLKPSYNSEAVAAIKASLNFGRSPEASGRTISGLQNLGNTCFMNSVIQCLSYHPKLASYFCSEQYYNHINLNSQYGSKGELAVEFGALVEKLNSHRHRYIEPKSFRESIIKHIGFAGNEQQDSHEFMMMLFDKLHHDLNIHARDNLKQNGVMSQYGNGNSDDSNMHIPRATLGYQFWKKHLEMNKSIVSDLFEGIFMSTLTCSFCRGQSNTFEVFNCLSLPIPSESRCHLRDCLSHFSNPERIEAAWECPRCKQKREADKKIVICKLPEVLVIHLKRFSLDGRWRQKLQTTVDFPLAGLSVDCTNVLPQAAYGSNPPKSSYGLYAVVNHFGHLDGGHYTAYCKLENNRWYTFDDSNVSELPDTSVCGQAAYLLFYASKSRAFE